MVDNNTPRRPGRPRKELPKNVVPRKPGRPPKKLQEHTRLKPTPVSEDFVIPKRGKPTYYEPWMCDKIVEVAAAGGHLSQMVIALGLRSVQTHYDWMEKHPEYKEAYELAKIHSKAFYENINLKGTMGEIDKFNVVGLALTMNAKFPDEYKRNVGAGGVELTVNNNTVNLSSPERDMRIAQLLEKFQSLGYDLGTIGQTAAALSAPVIEGEFEDGK